MFCSKCGKELDNGEKSCSNCAAEVNSTSNTTKTVVNVPHKVKPIYMVTAIIAILLLLVLLFHIKGRNELIGTWVNTRYSDNTITFRKNGTYVSTDDYYGTESGTYTVDKREGCYILVGPSGGTAVVYYIISGDTMIIKDSQVTFVKK